MDWTGCPAMHGIEPRNFVSLVSRPRFVDAGRQHRQSRQRRGAKRGRGRETGTQLVFLICRLLRRSTFPAQRVPPSQIFGLPVCQSSLRGCKKIWTGTFATTDCAGFAFWYVPANNGLIGLWCVAPFSGDFLVALMLGRRSRFAGSLRWWLACVLAVALMVFITTPNIVETAPGALDMLRSKYHPMRLGLCFLSLAVVGLAVMLHDLTAQAHGKGRHAWRVAVAAAAAMAVVHQWILHLRPLVSVDVLLVSLRFGVRWLDAAFVLRQLCFLHDSRCTERKKGTAKAASSHCTPKKANRPVGNRNRHLPGAQNWAKTVQTEHARSGVVFGETVFPVGALGKMSSFAPRKHVLSRSERRLCSSLPENDSRPRCRCVPATQIRQLLFCRSLLVVQQGDGFERLAF
jgi:hypothetical protein